MKQDIHPIYFPKAKIVCSCGKTHIIGSTKEKMEIEICSNCHPFFTGQEKFIDTAGRVEKFKARQAKAASNATQSKTKTSKAKTKKK